MEHGRLRTILWGIFVTASLCGLVGWLVLLFLAPDVGPRK